MALSFFLILLPGLPVKNSLPVEQTHSANIISFSIYENENEPRLDDFLPLFVCFGTKIFSQHQTSTTFSELVREDGSTLLLPRSPARFLTSTPKPRAEERWPPVALCRAGLGSRLGRCWALPTGEQHPSRQARLSPSAPAKKSATAFAVALFFVIERNVLATRHGCAAHSACRGASACRWHARYGAGLGSRLGRCWALPTGEQHPSRQPKPKSFCHFQNSQVSLLRCLAFSLVCGMIWQ